MYVRGEGGAVIAQIERADSGGSSTLDYIHYDQLGSATEVSSSEGSATKVKFDPFGARLSSNLPRSQLSNPLPRVTLGFLGQETEDDLGLINLNGRIYDPHIMRFLSADPLISRPADSQGYNPYSYAYNSPMRWVDPSGFSGCDGFFLFPACGGDSGGGDDGGGGQVGGGNGRGGSSDNGGQTCALPPCPSQCPEGGCGGRPSTSGSTAPEPPKLTGIGSGFGGICAFSDTWVGATVGDGFGDGTSTGSAGSLLQEIGSGFVYAIPGYSNAQIASEAWNRGDYVLWAINEIGSAADIGLAIMTFGGSTLLKAPMLATRGGEALLNPVRNFAAGQLEQHFAKHAAEWGAGNITKIAYLRRAQALLSREVGGDILGAVRANGDILRYNVRTNEFAVGTAEGLIRTLFRPLEGLEYWLRQVL